MLVNMQLRLLKQLLGRLDPNIVTARTVTRLPFSMQRGSGMNETEQEPHPRGSCSVTLDFILTLTSTSISHLSSDTILYEQQIIERRRLLSILY
jgi:hypothetical protein